MGMTERDRKVLAVVAALVVFGGFWFLVVGKKRSAISAAETAQITAQAELESAKAAEQQSKTVAKVKPVAYSRLLRLGKAIPVDEDFESLLVQVNDLSVDADVSFVSLSASTGQSAAAASGATGQTTCDATAAAGASGATTASPTTGATGASGSTGSTAETWVGKSRDKADGAVVQSDQANSGSAAASAAVDCTTAPTLTDIAASAAGLETQAYTFAFTGSFYNLKDVYDGILDLVEVRNGRVGVSGRLLDINSIAMTVSDFPDLSASVQMTGYKLPSSAAAAQGASSGAVTPNAATPAAAPAPAASGQAGPN